MINFVTENYLTIFAALGAVVTAATAITAITPTKKDDAIVGKVRKIIEFLSLKIKS